MAKIAFSKSHFSQKSHFRSQVFLKIAFSKSQFSQDSHYFKYQIQVNLWTKSEILPQCAFYTIPNFHFRSNLKKAENPIFIFLDKNWICNIVCFITYGFWFNFQSQHAIILQRSSEKFVKKYKNLWEMVLLTPQHHISPQNKYTTSLMVYIGLEFKTRQKRQTVRKQWFCLYSRPLNSTQKPSVSKFLKPSEFFGDGWWDGFWLIVSIDGFATKQFLETFDKNGWN